MKLIFSLVLSLMLFTCCKNQAPKNNTENNKVITITTADYELIKPAASKALLILFPGGGATAKEIKVDFKIVEKATQSGIAVLLMNFNLHLWIEAEDAEYLAKTISEAVEKNNLKTNDVFIGGMSMGGNVALTLSNYLAKINSAQKPKGVFIVDSPIDLYALYISAQTDMAHKDFSEERLVEPKWILNYFKEAFGGKDSLINNIQKVSPITRKTKNIENIKNLKNEKLRLYTEPDTLWWTKNRQTYFENTNAFTIQRTKELLSDQYWNRVELIQTKNQGYRANGERHPHSWSIVDVDDLINWILE